MILVQVFLLIIGFCALAALSVDLGYVTLTRMQMQNAVDAAALEGLRYRDEPALTAEEKRAKAAQFANEHFADNGTAANGAGPVIGLSAGVSDLNALQTIESLGYYTPALKANPANEPGGDVVTGSFAAGQPGVENADYERLDFTNAGDRALLVRMRRSNEEFDNITRSGGPALPVLFGRVTTMQPNASGYNPRIDGITVRATAIAEARPVRSVGTAGSPGAAGFAIRRATWETLSGATAVTIEAGGAILLGLTAIGRFIPPGSARVVGSLVQASAPQPDSGRYIPIFEEIEGVERVIGYGAGTLTFVGTAGTLTKEAAPQVAVANASVHLTGELPPLSPLERQLVLQANRQLQDAVLAPTLVR